MERKHALTTFDNPWDRNKDFDKWFLWDVKHGYNTVDAETADLTYDMTEDEENETIENTINEIMSNDLFGIYKRIELED